MSDPDGVLLAAMPAGRRAGFRAGGPAEGAPVAAGPRRRELAASLAALTGFYLVAGLYLRPIWRIWRTHITPSLWDPLLAVYLLKWTGHELGRGFAGFWDAPFFYPTRGVLAYTDHQLGPGLVATAWQAVVPGWVGAYNMLFLSSFALTGWTTTWVLRRSGRSWWAALLGGALYAFAPFRWDQVQHFDVLLMAAVPLTLWSFDRLLARPSWMTAAGFLVCYAVHLSGGCYLAGMIQFPLLVLAANRLPELWHGRRRLGAGGFALLAATAAVAAGLLAATFFEYWRVSARDALAWRADTARHWSASLLSFLQPSDSNLYAALWAPSLFRAENSLFPGIVATALCALGAWRLFPRRREPGGLGAGPARGAAADPPSGLHSGPPPRRSARRWRLLPLAVALLGLVGAELLTWRPAALAPWTPRSERLPFALCVTGVLLWALLCRKLEGRWPGQEVAALAPWPRGLLLAGLATLLLSTSLFYVPLSEVVPGLASMRVPARFQAFTMLTIAFGAAAAADRLAERWRAGGGPRAEARGTALFVPVALLAALVECAPWPLPWVAVPEERDFPPVYAWLAGQADVHALLELPLQDPALEGRGSPAIQAMYYGTRHWHPIVNGYSTYFPPAYRRLEETCCDPAPDPATLDGLTGQGVTHLLIHIHRSRLRRRWERRALEEWEALNARRCEVVYRDGDDVVYRLRPAAAGRQISP
ncbi:MAG TPA: hypothetical protein VHQ90_05980 [Thermoanaerobaculia bacterium]|nr:hypothetical protein [Thermoanaerobaculia bacterium]